MIRVAIVDDQPLVRAGFGAILAHVPDLDLVGEAADGAGRRRPGPSGTGPTSC